MRKSTNYYHNQKDGYYYVYYLPNENYVGMTVNVFGRKRDHKNRGMNVDGFKILSKCTSKSEARILECSYHQKGYNGKTGKYPFGIKNNGDKYMVRVAYGNKADGCTEYLGSYNTVSEAIKVRNEYIREVEAIDLTLM